MIPKTFFERFWGGEQKNELFVCMPFHKDFDSRFNDIIRFAAKNAGFDDAFRAEKDKSGNVVLTKIWDGIAHSRMVLIDLTDDPKTKEPHINGNVLYEAGVANVMREPEAVVIIRDQPQDSADFDVRGLTINRPINGILELNWLADLLRTSLQDYNFSESKRVKTAAESIDDIGLTLMFQTGGSPDESTHFNTNALQKMSVLRLLDLGLLRFATGGANKPNEYAYHWTPFGYAVMKYLHITRSKPSIRHI